MARDLTTNPMAIREACGLNHERQILAVACPADVPRAAKLFRFRDPKTGAEFPAQRSQQNLETAFIQLELRAGEEFQLVAQDQISAITDAVTLSTNDSHGIVANGKWAAELFLGEWRAEENALPSFEAPTPIRRMRIKDGPWRGSSFFDTRLPVRDISSVVLESGPLRIVTRFQARIGPAHSYTAHLTFDAGSDYIAVDEVFSCDSGDQIVWDFSGADLPEQIHLLNSTAGFATQSLHYFFDRRLARLASWNQYSQLHDFSDGYALTFSQNDDVIGCVALGGGDWDGNSHNFLEAWARRWLPGDPTSRRLVPPEAKADAAPSPEKIAARPANECEPHFSLEGWLHHGRRRFALVLTSREKLRFLEWNAAPPLGHFETEPDRERYRQQQSLLRRIHTQHGMFPLADQLKLCWSWPQEKAPARIVAAEPPWEHADKPESSQAEPGTIAERVAQMREFLAARVFGFWEGSGAAYTNPVVSRRLAHDLADWEWLAAKGRLTSALSEQIRTWFVFLCHLFSSDHYYPGAASMNLGDPSKRLEPTIAGMANQNFFTDVFNLPGMAAQVFQSHPDAAKWRERFSRMWRRQLEYHVYPQSGVWEESHTYFHHILQTIIPTLERRRDDGVEDGFAEPAFQRAVASLLKMLTPKDSYFDGKRHVVALGDHGVDLNDLYRPLYRTLAGHITKSNPDLAAYLAWAYLEMGGDQPLTMKPKSVPWRNEYVQGLGYFFRSRDDRGESLMVLRSGNSWGHHHNDEGSLQYFYAGRAWIVDSAFSYPQATAIRKFRADGHSRWTPRDLDPINHFWQFNRGWITSHQDDGAFPYAVAFTPIYMTESAAQHYIPLRFPVLHWRCVVQLAPFAFLIVDRSNVSIPQVTRFHVPSDALVVVDATVSPPIDSGAYLRIQPLVGLQPAQIANTDRPTQAGERFTTREIRYAWKEQPLSALLIAVETAGLPSSFSIHHDREQVSVHHAGFIAELDVSNPDKISLLDPQTGLRSTIPLTG
jgi:hypothetical protein